VLVAIGLGTIYLRAQLGLRIDPRASARGENIKTDNGIHRLEDERPPLALRLLLSVRHPVNLQLVIV
jgi:hypothetical protein